MNNPNANKTNSQKTIVIEKLPFQIEKMIGKRARIGVVVLSTDYTLEHEFRNILTSPGVDFYHARIANSVTITTKTLSDMKPLITQTADLILPGDDLDVVAYGCTSASVVLGDDVIAGLLNAAKPTAKTTNPAFAAAAALNALGAKRIAILTPYEREVNELVQKSMEEKGFEIKYLELHIKQIKDKIMNEYSALPADLAQAKKRLFELENFIKRVKTGIIAKDVNQDNQIVS